MQNLALTSQFSNSGRRGNSSSNSFQSIVLNGVLPPNDDGRVEGIQLFDPKTKKYKHYNYRPDSPLNPGGFFEWGIQPMDDVPGGNDHSGGDTVGGGKGSGGGDGGSNSNYQSYSGRWFGWDSFLNIGLPEVGVFMPGDAYWEQKAREDYINRVLNNVTTLLENPHATSQVLDTVRNSLRNLFNSLGVDLNDDIITKEIRDLLYQLFAAFNPFNQNLLNEIKDYIRSGEFRSNSNIPDIMANPDFTRDKIDFTLVDTISFRHIKPPFGMPSSTLGYISSITIKLKFEVKNGKTYMKIFADVTFVDNYGNEDTIKPAPILFQEVIS